ncbi:MAG: CheR family methyltransferase [Bacteroidales bacterium]
MLSQNDFKRLARFIEGYCGIRMPESKRTMLEGRLRRRLTALHLDDFHQYCRYVFDEHGLEEEAVHLIDAVTTNKTDFFREPEHFRYLAGTALPRLLQLRGADRTPRLVVWSAACSVGAEPYTLAMVLADMAARNQAFDFTVLATDISTKVLAKAAMGIYAEDMIAPVPPQYREEFFMRARDQHRREMRVVPELRAKIRFARMNLLEDPYPMDQPADVVFCRNVLIYFDKPTQHRVLERLCDALRPGGYLFLGHSESLDTNRLPVVQEAPTVFVRT